EVEDVDVIAHRGAVGGGPVVAEHEDLVPVAQGDLQHQGNEVGFHHPVFTDVPVGSGHVEIAQAGSPQAIGMGIGGDRVIDGQLRGAVGVGGGGGHVLGDGNLFRFTVGGRGGGEHEVVHAVGAHRIQQGQGGDHIMLPVVGRVFHGFAHEGAGREALHLV